MLVLDVVSQRLRLGILLHNLDYSLELLDLEVFFLVMHALFPILLSDFDLFIDEGDVVEDFCNDEPKDIENAPFAVQVLALPSIEIFTFQQMLLLR